MPRQQLHGHVPAAVNGLRPLAAMPASNRLDLAIGLPLRHRPALTNLLSELYQPGSTNFHRFITPEQFAAQFGPSENDYEALARFAEANGLKVTGRHPNRMLLDVSGSVGDIERALHVQLNVYRHPNENRTFFAPDREPSLDLAVPVLSISGLDDFLLPHPMLRRSSFGAVATATGSVPGNERSADLNPVAYTGSGPRGNFLGKDFRAAYAPGVTFDGTGQRVGLLEFDGFYPSDVRTYAQLAGLPSVPLTTVLLDGASGVPGFQNIEVALDIDMAICMAPGLAGVIVYEGRLGNDILNRMATDNLARQLSSSWGFGAAADATRDQIFQQFAAQGQSFFQASGDYGAWAGPIYPPSDNPFITVVGGTTLSTADFGGGWLEETAWPYSGGGISTLYSIPAWQAGLASAANQASTSMRNIPDVACVADGIWLVANNGEQAVIGGTSASAPLWAGFAALANQCAAASSQPPVGFINPALYTLGRSTVYGTACHDIATGNNTNNTSPDKFFAVGGYDLCTGWGTPGGSNLIAALVSPVELLSIQPGGGFVFTGPVGGPFFPEPQVLLLTNNTTAPLGWAAGSSAVWLSLSPNAGTVAPGGPASQVSLSVGASATNLAPGAYLASLWFTNLQSSTVQQRPVTLNVVTVPVITSQPTNQTLFEGMSTSFAVGISNPASLTYQWRQDNGAGLTNLSDGAQVSGATTPLLTLSNVSSGNVGAYSVLVSNAAGAVTSVNAFLAIVPWRPVLLTQPLSQTVLPGQTVDLGVMAVGSQPLSFQWQRSGTNLTDGGNLAGTGTSRLHLSNVSPVDGGTYAVVVSNSLGVTVSTDAVLSVVPVTSPEMTMTTFYSFVDGHPNGLVQAGDGSFYGTTQNGGTNGAGTVFAWQPGNNPARLYSFAGPNDGANPQAALAPGAGGNFYGTAFQGGAYGDGTVFELTPAGDLSPLLSFDNTNGAFPYAGLTRAADGQFYGVTWQGGTYHRGTVFKLTTNGVHTVLYSFSNGADGGHPHGELVQAADGNFYGTTYKGGLFGLGTVFRITPTGFFTSLASFNQTNGAFPYAGLTLGRDGSFYGTTSQGGAGGSGVIFRMSTAGTLCPLYSFSGGSDGAGPAASLLQASDGNFYGTTAAGGAYGNGTVFRISPTGELTTVATFDGFNGANPQAPLVEGMDRNLYGTAHDGGANGLGTLFGLSVNSAPEITAQPASQAVNVGAQVVLEVAVIGSTPLSYQWRKDGVNLSDGDNLSGSGKRVLTLNGAQLADSGTYSVVVSNALGSVVSSDALLQVSASPPLLLSQPTNQTLVPGALATFSVNAAGNLPLTYQWQKDGAPLSDGGNLFGSLTSTLVLTNITEANNGAYTVCVTNSLGAVTSSPALLTVIPPSAPGTRFATIHIFTGGDDGANPNQLVQGTNGYLYGTTKYGGAYGVGCAFSLSPGSALTPLCSFGPTTGSMPAAGLVQGNDGDFYGTTQAGGPSGSGVLFRLTADGSLSVLHSFTGTDGANPAATLVQGSDGLFYGTARTGGASGYGTVFRAASDGTISTLYSFSNGIDGAFPTSSLVAALDGNLYAVTAGGGSYAKGNIFKLSPAGALSVLYSFTGGADGYAPVGPLAIGDDGSFFGATKHNVFMGYEFYGTLFQARTNGALTTVYTLNGFTRDGFYPYAGLLAASDGNFYGTTHDGGAYGYGTLFQLTPAGSFTRLLSFDGFAVGGNPESVLIQGTDGSLYGTTTMGGPGGQGTAFRLSFTGAPQITAPPQSQTVPVSGNVKLSAAVFGAPPLSFRWQKNGADLLDGGNVFGAATRILNMTNVSLGDSGNYSLLVSNALGWTTSLPAAVRVVTAPAFQSVYRTNATLVLTWSTSPGEQYQLQSAPAAGSGSWLNLGPVLTATTNTLSASDSIGTNTQRFYRVLMLP